MKLFCAFAVLALGQKRSLDQMSEKRRARLKLKEASSTTTTTTGRILNHRKNCFDRGELIEFELSFESPNSYDNYN